MSITSRITSMEEHVTNAYNGLQGLGADLTGIDKNIDNIAQVLDNIYDSMPQVSGEGTSLTLDDTRVGKIKSTLKGNTSQTTYSGKNLANTKITNWNYLGVSVSYDEGTQILTINGTSTGNASLSFGTYNFSPISVSSGERLNLVVKYVSGSVTSNDNGRILLADENYTLSMFIPLNGINTDKSEYKNINSNLNYNILQIGYKNGDVYNNLKIKIMVCKGSDISYEPYVGKTPSPNPSYPQPVNVVSGDNEIEVCGNNLFNKDNIFVGYLKEDGTLSTDTAYRTSDFMPIRPNITYYKTSTGSPRTKYFDINKVPLNTTTYWDVPTGGSAGTFTTPNNAYYLRFSFPFAGSSAIDASTIMVKEGTDTTYEPYQGNTYNIDLPEGMELCKIGNYQDYFYKDSGKWYLHKEIGKVVLNGSETWILQSTKTSGYNRFRVEIGDNLVNTGSSNIIPMYCNKLLQTSPDGTFLRTQGIASDSNTNHYFNVYIEDTSTYTLANFKTWLSSNNLGVHYILATPTNTEITYQPLIDQLNLLEKVMSKDGQTNISQVNNDLPFIISASALKEWQESASLNSTLSMVNPLSLGNTLNTQENNTQPIEVDNIEPLEEEENEES